MPVSFNRIPPNLRVPLFWAEFDASQAGYLAAAQPACLFGHQTSAGVAPVAKPMLVGDVDSAIGIFGAGSMLASMVDVYRRNDPTGELWCVPVAEPSGAEAEGTATFAGTPTTGGTVAVYVGTSRYPLAVTTQSTPDTLATALAAAINADPLRACSAAHASGVVTLTATHPGAAGNELLLSINRAGVPGGEWTPAGLTVTVAPFAGGSGTVDIAPALLALADAEYDYLGCPWADTAALDAIKIAFGEQSGRWA
jgi:phage tail sheath gpL-like